MEPFTRVRQLARCATTTASSVQRQYISSGSSAILTKPTYLSPTVGFQLTGLLSRAQTICRRLIPGQGFRSDESDDERDQHIIHSYGSQAWADASSHPSQRSEDDYDAAECVTAAFHIYDDVCGYQNPGDDVEARDRDDYCFQDQEGCGRDEPSSTGEIKRDRLTSEGGNMRVQKKFQRT
ncbi:hypothetical protein M758_UG044900 [Ceratodon purpureus]|nr:hypothetical protein M758_UG044900 [Ceratodon purpureus]